MKLIFNGEEYFGPRGPAGPDGTPIGSIISYLGRTAPRDYLTCDGGEYSISDYPELAAFFQKEFGSANHFGGDGESTFAVPDMRQAGSAMLHCIKAAESFQAQDIYSDEECRIGTWLDNKPLYRKVYRYKDLVVNGTGTNSGETTIAADVGFVDTLVSGAWNGSYATGAAAKIYQQAYVISTGIVLLNKITVGSPTIKECCVILEYTKTEEQEG